MITDCRDGKIDLIIVKSVSRFARNQLDFIGIYRELKALPNPVGIYIGDINLNILDTNSEFILGVMSIVAQGESKQKSASITRSSLSNLSVGYRLYRLTICLAIQRKIINGLSLTRMNQRLFDSFIALISKA